METLTTLIKIYKQDVDIIARDIFSLEEKKKFILDILNKLIINLKNEIEKYKSNPMYAFALRNYIKLMKDREEEARRNIEDLELMLKHTRELLYTKYSELKKFEIVLENRNMREKEIRAKKEIDELDEIYVLKTNNNSRRIN